MFVFRGRAGVTATPAGREANRQPFLFLSYKITPRFYKTKKYFTILRSGYIKNPPPREAKMYFVGVLYTNSNSCSLFPCIDREQAEHKLKAIIGGRKSRKMSEDLYYVYYNIGDIYQYDRVFIGKCDEDIEKTVKIQSETRDREDLEFRRKYKYKYQQKVNYGG